MPQLPVPAAAVGLFTAAAAAASAGSKGSSANSGIRSSIQLTHDLMHMHTLSKRLLPVPAAGAADDAVPNCKLAADPATDGHRHQQQQRASQVSLFHDEALNVFFRRMSWSPDGEVAAARTLVPGHRAVCRAVAVLPVQCHLGQCCNLSCNICKFALYMYLTLLPNILLSWKMSLEDVTGRCHEKWSGLVVPSGGLLAQNLARG
jgi:hypothetical protein